jgi:N-acetylglutamate synthase-like GNAT family acetyltransferase
MREVRYVEQIPSIDDYFPLFLSTGWNDQYKFTKVDILKSISNSWFTVCAYVENDLVGFGRVISDGVHHAFVVDIIVDPDYQRHGIGKRIVERLIEKCKESKIRDIQAFSTEETAGFYSKSGFEISAHNPLGMQVSYTGGEG